MYPNGLKSQFEGFAKNISTGIISTGLITAILTFLWVTATISAPINLIKAICLTNVANIITYSIFCLVIMVQIIFYSTNIGNYKFYLVPLYPVAILWFLIIILYSFVRKIFFRSVVWKNRKIKI